MVDTGAAIRRGHPVSFVFLAIWSFIAAVIASTLTSDFNKNHNSPSAETTGAVRYNVFAQWWTFLFSLIYLGLFLTGAGGAVTSIAGHAVGLFFTWLFVLAGAGAISASTNDNPFIYHSSRQALEAFAWITWIQLTFMLAFVAFVGGKAFRGGRGFKEGLGN
ncbi:uncharacterized protein FA14DRAFT_68411 [Meira miltonrushii]|uniref:MARVEL domain-containing protein n=1 Tax=Meira miltonrushii TaxID=1280837 RepID=A0A316V9Z6_9BASI|nr:uncharacterized protein FA14DRAFT_68411 [Meira miltonrushii]PWN34094.1 hypothetical protein FA14DRAFT_68411 [Meira miltonrushii]